MDKYKVILRIEETKRLASEKKYKEAYEEMKFLNLAKMKNYEDLIIFADIFVRNKKYVEAKELLERLHRKTVTRRLLTQLIFVSAKTKNFVDSEKYYEEYVKIAPKDINRYILRYRIDKEKGLSKDILIKTLEELKEYDYIEEWAYELAKLYHKSGRSKECIRECSNIELWFGDGIVVEKAKLLREHHISALSDEPLGKLSNEIMDFTATGKLIDLLGMIPVTKEEEDSFANTSEFEKDNDKVDVENRKIVPECKEEEYICEEASGSEMREISGVEMGEVSGSEMQEVGLNDNKYSEEQIDKMMGEIIGDNKTEEREREEYNKIIGRDDNDEEEKEELAKILVWDDKKEKPAKHNSFVQAFKNMLAIKDYDRFEDDLLEEQEEESAEEEEDEDEFNDFDADEKNESKLDYENLNEEEEAHNEDGNQEDYYEDDNEEEVKVELSDIDFDPELLELERIIGEKKSKQEIDARANNVERDIRKDLAQEISSYVEEEKKVKNEFKEDMQKLDAMVTKRIVGVDDILEENNNGEKEEAEATKVAKTEPEIKEEQPVVKVEESVAKEIKEEPVAKVVDQPRPQVDESTQRENVEEVLAKTVIPGKSVEPVKVDKKKTQVSSDLFRNFAKNEYLNDVLVKAFARVDENKKCAHFIISGESKTGKSTLAKMIAKQLKNMGALSTGKVARIEAAKFNNVDLELKQDSLADCCLIISNAQEISPYAITGLISMIIKFNGRTMVILETSDADVILKKTSEVSAYFTNVIEMPKYSVDDLIELAISYADAKEYRINESAEFAIRNILQERIESLSQTKLVECVISIIDNAVNNAHSRNRNKIKEMITSKTADFEGFNEIDMQDIMPL